MGWSEGFIAVDWGTTNRRAYRFDANGICTDEFEDARGVISITQKEFPAAVAQISERLGSGPMLLAGMIGSSRGWIETPYLRCPAAIEQLAGNIVWAEEERVAIVPGLSTKGDNHADVMRGEEVQLFGAAASGLIAADAFVCHPGTHNKWVAMADGRITDFRTVMTGEIFHLLREHGILADLLAAEVRVGEAFLAGVRRGLAGCTMTAELFSVRARVLLGEARREDAASFTSGLLIGADVHFGTAMTTAKDVFVMGRPELTSLYAAALTEAGRNAIEVDGEKAFIAGAVALASVIG